MGLPVMVACDVCHPDAAAPVDGNAALFQPTREDIRAGDEALKRDAAAWAETVDGYLENAGKRRDKRHSVTMLRQTPLVLQLLGAKNPRLNASLHLLKDGLGRHDLPADVIKQLPAALADPVMVFQSATQAGDLVMMLDLKDRNGGTVVVPVALEIEDGSKAYTVNMATTVYGKSDEKTGKPKDGWFAEQIRAGNLRYRNERKSREWQRKADPGRTHWGPIPRVAPRLSGSASRVTVFTEADLVKLREGNPTLYQRQAASPAPGRENRLAARFAALPPVEADSSQWFGEGKAIDGTPETLRESVKAWAKQRYPEGMTVTNADRGWDVRITPRGIKASLSHDFDETLARSVPFIPQLVEGGIHVASIEKKPGLVSHIFANRIRLDGKEYVVGFVLREDRNNNRFYDHELTQIIDPDRLIPSRDTSEEALGHWARANQGTVMEILRERLGVKDGTGRRHSL